MFSTSLQLVLFRTSSLLRPSATCPSPTTDDDGVRCGGGETGKNRWWTDVGGIGTERMHRVRGARGGAKGNTERERAEEAAAWRESPVQRRRHAVCGATILIRRWIYGLNHRRIISDSRALLPPTETYACLFADNCIPVYLSPPLLYISSSLTFVLSTLRTHLCHLPPYVGTRYFRVWIPVFVLPEGEERGGEREGEGEREGLDGTTTKNRIRRMDRGNEISYSLVSANWCGEAGLRWRVIGERIFRARNPRLCWFQREI